MKYKNNSGLKQIAIINGKKEIVPSGVIFETEREIIHPGFEKVDDATPVTFKKLAPKLVKSDSLELIQRQINDIKKDTSVSESVALTQSLSKQVAELTQKTENLDILVQVQETLNNLKNDNDEKFSMIFKRLEILKNAVQTIELEVDQALYGDESDTPKSR
jgi:hypothetical protein